MAYEKKIEPLARYEIFMAGFMLQMWIIFLNILPWATWSNECSVNEVILHGDVSSQESTFEVHSCVTNHRNNFLGASVFLLIGFPIIVGHVYYMNRIFDTLMSFVNNGILRWLYSGSWMIVACIMCTVLPSLMIFVSYYDWEFINGYEYIGYALQFQFLHLILIIRDSLMIPLGVVGAMPWIAQLLITLGLMRSKHYKFTEETRSELVKTITKCGKCGKITQVIISLIMTLIILFSAFADVLDFAKEGFFSYHGESQHLEIILFITWQIQCIMLYGLTCRFDTVSKMLSQNIKPIDNNSSANGGSSVGLGNLDSLR